MTSKTCARSSATWPATPSNSPSAARSGLRLGLIRSEAEQAEVEFCVADTGPGIPTDKLALLSGLLVQADGSSIRRHGGIGVGLPIARKLIELLGGTLRIESQPGKGSRFSFVLPFALPTAH